LKTSEVFSGTYDYWAAELCEGYFIAGKFQEKNGRCIRHQVDDSMHLLEWDGRPDSKGNNSSKQKAKYYRCNLDKKPEFCKMVISE
jgi:hypothetical protein